MASKRGNKKERHIQQRAKQTAPQVPPGQPPAAPASPSSSDVPEPPARSVIAVFVLDRLKHLRWVWTTIIVSVTVITLLEGYPWLDLQKDDSLDPNNPYRTMFLVVNQGYAPITHIEADCIFAFDTRSGLKFSDNEFITSIVGVHWHGDKSTLPCIRVVEYSNEPHIPSDIVQLPPKEHIQNANMRIKITYSMLGIDIPPFRRSQTFHVVALAAKDNSYRWEFAK
jgi:hypothetical protein